MKTLKFILFVLLMGVCIMQPETIMTIIEKLNRKEHVETSEMSALRLTIAHDEKTLRMLRAFAQSGGLHPRFDEFSAGYGEFDTTPTDALYLRLTTDFTAADGVAEEVVFDVQMHASDSRLFEWDDTDKEKIWIPASLNDRVMLVTGTVVFRSNAVGYRTVFLNAYDKDGTFLDAQPLVQIPPVDGTFTVVSFSKPHIIREYASNGEGYYTISVFQNSGGDLDISTVEVSFLLIR